MDLRRRRPPPALGDAPVPEAELLRAAVHELRTPLASVGALVRALRRPGALTGADRDSALRLVEAQVEQLSGLLDRLRQHSEGRPPSWQARPERLPELVTSSVAAAGLPRDRVRVHLERDLDVVVVDGVCCRQILTNLLENARVHGSPDAPVDLRVGRTADRLLLQVRNAPAPVPVPRAGAGVGMRVVDALADRAGGAVEVVEPEGGGCCVCVSLPLTG